MTGSHVHRIVRVRRSVLECYSWPHRRGLTSRAKPFVTDKFQSQDIFDLNVLLRDLKDAGSAGGVTEGRTPSGIHATGGLSHQY
eukprot:g50027.t1